MKQQRVSYGVALSPSLSVSLPPKGYRGEPNVISTSNGPFDTPEVRHFKGRVKARHETFNSRIKKFKCLDDRFIHSHQKHKTCFEAVCVIGQYQMEDPSSGTLFDA